jgi:TatA/E family protein of Tat protein translocase
LAPERRRGKVFLFVFEFLSTQELLLILLAALILFGPRKLPQLARSVGKSLAEFKRASEDFKTQWEKEVEREASGLRQEINEVATLGTADAPPPAALPEPSPALAVPPLETPGPVAATTTPAPPPASKRDWL